MTRVRPLARLRALLAGLAIVLLTFSTAGAIVLVTAQAAHAAAVVITGPPASAGITQNPTLFTGTGTPGDTVTLSATLLTASPCASGVTVDAGGSWSCDANFSAPGGATTIVATQTGDGSTDNGSYDVAFAPTEQLTPTSPGRYATNNSSPVIPGTDAISGGTIHGTLTDGTSTYDCFYNVISGPSFSCTGFPVVPDGDYALQLTQRFGTATSVPTAPLAVRIDTAGPTGAPQFVAPYDSSGPNANVHTSDPSMPVSGTYSSAGVPEAYATVHVEADVELGPVSNNNGGTPSYCDAITDAAGNWSCTPPTPMTFGAYYGFTVWGADEAGSTGISPDPEFGVYVDVPPPVPDSANVLAQQPIIELTGTGVAGATVHGVFSNGQTCDAVVNSGFYECDVTLAPATDGSYSVDLSQTVGTAVSPTTAHVTVVLDQTPPTAYPTFSGPWTTGSSPARAVVTSPPIFSGTADPYAQVSVLVATDPDGYPANVVPDQPVCSATADAEGAWSCDPSVEGLAMGMSYSVGAEQWDAADNAGPAAVATFELYLDEPPDAPSISTPAADAASQLRAGDVVTFSGTTDPATTVKVYEGATLLCQAFSSSGSWSCATASPSGGSHTVAALAVDQLGISSSVVTRTFTVLPKAIAKALLAFVIGVTDSEGNPLDGSELTPGQTIILWSSGLPVGSTVSAELHSTPYPLGSSTVGGDGIFKLKTQIPLDVEPGDHEFSVTVTPTGDTPTTVTSHTSVAPAAVTAVDDTSAQPQSDRSAPRRASHPADGLDSPSTFAATLPVFGSFPITPTSVAVTAGIALAFLLLVAFPSELLEDTIRENYDRAFGWLTPLRRRIEHLRGRWGRMLRNPWAGITVSVVATSVILAFSDPSFGFNGASVRLLLGMIISVVVINIGVNLLVLKVAKQEYGDAGFIRPMPAALIIVALSVLVSRLADISPGFLFGLVMGVAYARELKAVQEAKLALLSAAFTIAAGILSWLGFSALRAAGGSGFWYELSLESLVAITLEAVGTMIIAMLPLTFLDGKTIFRWNKWAWAGIYLVTVLVFVVIVMPISNNWGAMSAPLFGWGTLFVVFAVVAFGTWAVFRFVPRRPTGVSSSSPAAEEAPRQPQLQSPPR